MLEIVKFESTDIALMSEFIELPWKIYPGRYLWIPPLRESVFLEFSQANAFFTHGELQMFLCKRDGETVGRIVASIDHLLAQTHVGHFGYFECLNDPEVADKLIGAAEAWIRSKGKTEIHGPINMSIFQNYRIQTKGFQCKPFFTEPRTPDYYQQLLEQSGFKQFASWNSWDLAKDELKIFSQSMEEKVTSFEEKMQGYEFVTYDMNDFDTECRALHSIILETFSQNYGFSRISEEEYLQQFQGSKHFLFSGARRVVKDNETVAYSYGLFDPIEAFLSANGNLKDLHFSAQSMPGVVLHAFGIRKAHRNRGLAEKIFKIAIDVCLQASFPYVIGALAKEGPTAYDRFGAPSRSYAVFAKSL